MDFKDLKGLQWAYEVVNGDFIANKWVKLECQRCKCKKVSLSVQ